MEKNQINKITTFLTPSTKNKNVLIKLINLLIND
jgi:hypothetical protein